MLEIWCSSILPCAWGARMQILRGASTLYWCHSLCICKATNAVNRIQNAWCKQNPMPPKVVAWTQCLPKVGHGLLDVRWIATLCSDKHIRVCAVSCENTMFRHQITCRTRLRRRNLIFFTSMSHLKKFWFWVKNAWNLVFFDFTLCVRGSYATTRRCINPILVSQPLYM